MIPIFSTKAHNEIIKSLNYVYEENLLITTAYDKRVKIWDSNTGKSIDSF